MKGAFTSRAALKSVPRLGDKTFEQAAGFLRVMGGENPLDASAVHPESYPLVEKILADIKKDIKAVIGERADQDPEPGQVCRRQVRRADHHRHPEGTGKAGPRSASGIHHRHLQGRRGRDQGPAPDMILEGVVTNVAAFGAFVDIGVHQDGLVHISALSNTFVKDPHTVVKAGQVVKVKVLEVDPSASASP
jgi:uncharacterized protein